MAKPEVVKLGFLVPSHLMSHELSEETFMTHLSDKKNSDGKILLDFVDYLIKYTKTFDKVYFLVSKEIPKILPNGTLKGFIGNINRKEVDIAVQPFINDELKAKFVDFSYPFRLISATFVTQMPEYKPEVLGILRTFSWPLWIFILLILIAMSLIYYISFKNKYSFHKVSLHTFAVLLRQTSILKPSTTTERLLIYSWVVGAMLICFAYDSVFLSFLAFPPIFPIKDVSQLAKSILNGEYHCVTPTVSAYYDLLTTTKDKNLKVLGKDILKNNFDRDEVWLDFLYGNLNQKLAFIVHQGVTDILSVGNKFVSEDRFLEFIPGMMIRKDFCCKKVIDTFVHKMIASGLYSKYESDKSFMYRLPLLLKYQEKETLKRKLTLTDVAPAFMFLITGHFISFILFMGEIWIHPGRKMHHLKNIKERCPKNFCFVRIERD